MAAKSRKPSASKSRRKIPRTQRKAARLKVAHTSPDAVARATELTASGVNEQKAGNFDAAEALYRKALNLCPDYGHALHFLGVVHHQRGRHDEAARLIEKAVAQIPDYADCHSNLGAVRMALDDVEAAAASLRRALELDPRNVSYLGNLAAALKKLEDWKGAAACYEQAIAIAPDSPDYYKRLGDMYSARREHEATLAPFQRYLELVPDDADVHNNLAYAMERLDLLEEAEKHYRRACELAPEAPELLHNLGTVLRKLDRSDEAKEFFDRAYSADPETWNHLANLAAIHVNNGRYKDAIEIYERFIEDWSDDKNRLNDYGIALAQSGKPREAIEILDRTIDLAPDFPEAYTNRATAKASLSNRAGAVEDLKKALSLRPNFLHPLLNLGINLMFLRKYDEAYLYARALVMAEDYKPGFFSNAHKVFRGLVDFDAVEELGDLWAAIRDGELKAAAFNFLEMLVVTESEAEIETMAELHRDWGGWLSQTVTIDPLPPPAPRRSGGKLRLGLLSSDLRSHSVAKFVLPLVENYDRGAFEIYCYSPFDSATDAIQQRFKDNVAGFRIVANTSYRETAEIIRDDEVDILFELNGFTRDSRINAMEYRPAPVQVAWLGYPFTTGIGEIDYLLLDRYCRPDNESWLTEEVLTMPESWVCFGEFPDDFISAQLPHERNDGVFTFGTLNNPYKYTPRILDLWARALHAVPGSRFLFVRPESRSKIFVSNMCKEFGKRGIAPDRLYFVNNRDQTYEIDENEFQLTHHYYYDEIDLSLDTFPVTGGTTTCDALWMGVPVVGLFGPSVHQRMCYSILHNAGLGDLCAATDEEYIEKAVALANDHDRLRDIRHNQRDRLRQSPLCDAKRFTENFQNLMLEVADRHNLR